MPDGLRLPFLLATAGLLGVGLAGHDVLAQPGCTPAWQTPLNASFQDYATSFSLLDLDHTGRPVPIICGRPFGGAFGGPCAAVYRGGAWVPLDPAIVNTGTGAVMYDFDGPGPDLPQLVVVGAMRNEEGSPFTSIGRLTPSGWQTLAPNGFPVILCVKILDEDGPGPMPPSLYVGTGGAGVQRWNGVDFDRPSFLELGSHNAVDIDVVDLDGSGPLPIGLVCLTANGVVLHDGPHWRAVTTTARQPRGLAVHQPDGAAAPSVYIATIDGLQRLDAGQPFVAVATPERSLSNVASVAFDEGRALVYFGLDASGRSVVRRSFDLATWSVLADSSILGPETGRRGNFLDVVETSPGRASLALLRGGGNTVPSRLFVFGCPFEGGCAADFNEDGFIDAFDYDAFVEAYEGGDPRTDVTDDGFVDFFDYDAFVVLYETGC